MPRRASAKRYAQAAFQIALERGELDGWLDDLGALSGVLEDRELSGMLDSPQVPAARKLDAVSRVMKDTAGPLANNLVALLATRGLVHILRDVADEYAHLLDVHNGIERAEVVSAVLLDDAQSARVAEILRGIVGRDIRLSSIVDPTILGGLVARVGDRVLDGSARGKLQAMHRSIVEQAS